MIIVNLLSVIFCQVIVSSAPTNSVDHLVYLKTYGYLSPTKTDLVDKEESMVKAILDFQTMAGIEQTGNLNMETEQMMRLPRCGNPDKFHNSALINRVRRYINSKMSWRQIISYKITNYTQQLTHNEVDAVAAKAFKFWADLIPLKFIQVSANERADIVIKFAKKAHGDHYPFDGPSGVLAHAFFPEDGRAHFDDDETWSLRGQGINLLQVMTHEFGHLLGLLHSKHLESVMYPIYFKYNSSFSLSNDDIQAIQYKYGHDRIPTTMSPVTPSIDICNDSRVDALLYNGGGILAFKGEHFFTLFDNEKLDHSIQLTFPGAPTHIEAALSIKSRTFIFKSGMVYAYSKTSQTFVLEKGFPTDSNIIFPGIPEFLDAAFETNGIVYFISRSVYYTGPLSNNRTMPVTRTAVNITGLPLNIDGAYSWMENETTFFSEDTFYVSDKKVKKIIGKQSISKVFFKC